MAARSGHRKQPLQHVCRRERPHNVEGAALASLALARVLHVDDVISTELLDHLAVHHPDQLRWTIRYSKLFTRRDSPLWIHLKENCTCEQRQMFVLRSLRASAAAAGTL